VLLVLLVLVVLLWLTYRLLLCLHLLLQVL
jgi:hypothetical protein